MLQPLVRRTWAPIGQTPLLDQWDRRDRTSVITALTLSPKRRRVRMFFQLLDHNAKAEDFVWFLNDLRKELGRKLHVVWDNLGAHRKSGEFLPDDRMQVGPLPPTASLCPRTQPGRARLVDRQVGPAGERSAGGPGPPPNQREPRTQPTSVAATTPPKPLPLGWTRTRVSRFARA